MYRKTFLLKEPSLSLRVSLSLSSRGVCHWIVRVMSFRNLYFMWVCEASELNIWTVFAVGPNGANKNKNNNFASSGSDHRGPTIKSPTSELPNWQCTVRLVSVTVQFCFVYQIILLFDSRICIRCVPSLVEFIDGEDEIVLQRPSQGSYQTDELVKLVEYQSKSPAANSS